MTKLSTMNIKKLEKEVHKLNRQTSTKIKNHSWETIFKTTDKTMTHIFPGHINVVCDFHFNTITAFWNNDIIVKFSFIENKMTIDEYKQFLNGIAKTTKELKKFGYE
jgi:hypothetical protein